MATVQIADIYNPLTFARREQERNLQLNRFLRSGVLVIDPRLSAQASAGSNIGELPYFKPLGMEEPDYQNDDPNATSTPAKIGSDKMIWRLRSRHKSWSTMDLAVELALEDPTGAITDNIGKYWATNDEKDVIQTAMGLLADNIASNSGDMVHNIATDASGAPGVGELIGSDAIIDTVQTMGDHGDEGLGVIAMHSVPYRNLQKQNLIDFIPNARGEINIPVYQGKMVIVDDSLPAVSGTNRITYTSILFGSGAFAGGTATVKTPSELERKASAGNGGGQDILHSRNAGIIAPRGFSFTSASVVGQSATQAELATAGNWERKHARKNCRIAFLQTNG